MVSGQWLLLTILVVAADPMELTGLLKRCRSVTPLACGAAFARAGELSGIRFLMVANGAGPKLAGQAVRAVSDAVDAIVSTGLCGALDPALRLGDIFVAERVGSVPARIPKAARAFPRGLLHSSDRFIQTAAEKRELRDRTGAAAAEMEAAAVAECAAARGLPLYAIRVVSDEAGEDIAIDFNRMRDADGRFVRSRIVLAALRHPVTNVPELLRFARRAKAGAEALGDFLADCRF